MTLYQPAYRMTVYAPRSTDPTEATILTPTAGAPHSDNFKVASIQGLSGWQPYLDGNIRGRRGRINLLTKKTDTGRLRVRLIDKRTTEGGSNVNRWVTAYVGASDKRGQLVGLKVFIEESTDDGVTWASFFTGRIEDVELRGSRVVVTFTIRDMADDLNLEVFVGVPESTITYAFPAVVAPNGFVSAVGSYGPFDTIAQIPGTTVNTDTNVGEFTIETDLSSLDSDVRNKQIILSDGLAEAIGIPSGTGRFSLPPRIGNRIGAWVTSGSTGRFDPVWIELGDLAPGDPGNNTRWIKKLRVRELKDRHGGDDSSNPDFAAAPSDGSSVTYYIQTRDRPTAKRPYYIDDVEGAKLWQNMLEGKFSRLYQQDDTLPGSKAVGDVKFDVPFDSTEFTTLTNDTSLPKIRLIVGETKVKLFDFVEKFICQPLELGYYLNADGEVVPVDLRRPTSSAGLSTITDSDLTEQPLGWDHARASAVTQFRVISYFEQETDVLEGTMPLDVSEDLFVDASFGRTEIGDRPFEVNALGFRSSPNEDGGNEERTLLIQNHLRAMSEAIKFPFASGGITTELRCRRTSVPAAVMPGTLVLVNVTGLPDPDTNTRSGTRIMRCFERTEDGPTIRLGLLDLGEDVTADVPTVGTLAQETGNTKFGVKQALTLNAASEPVRVEYAITDTSTSTRPGATSNLWQFATVANATGDVFIRDLPSDSRIWTRLRSEGQEDDRLKLPSAWVFPTSGSPAGSIDTAAMTAPSALSTSGVDAKKADAVWTVGESDEIVEVYLHTPSSGSIDTATDRVARLSAGSSSYRLRNLSASTTYKWGVRHRDRFGGVSSLTTATFTSGATASAAPSITSIKVLQGTP